MKQQQINCYKCKYFYVTWDKNFPYGCKSMGFKSARLPHIDVHQVSGVNCLDYQEKSK